MTSPISPAVSTREAVDPALEAWRFLWVPLTPTPPAPSVAPAFPPPAAAQSATPSTALTIAETLPQKFAQAILPAVMAAYRQNAD